MQFSWDDDNEGHLAERHPDILPEEVDSIFERRVVMMDNTRGRSGTLFLGIDSKGRLLVVPADETADGVWRPRTAHQASSEWQRSAYAEDEDGDHDG